MDISKGIRESFELYRQNFSTLILATLVVAVGSLVTAGILAGPLVGGLLMLCLKRMRGEHAGVNEVFAYFNKFVPTFLIVVAMWIAMFIAGALGSIPLVGFLVQIAVGPAVGILFILAIGLIVEGNLEPMAALKQALQYFMTDPVRIWLYSFVIGLLSGIGAILFVIPVILTMPLGATGMAIAYRELSSREVGAITAK
ncbi:MAG: glycerophosphodiester phosphodiesterase [Anaerosporomusa subterranea]|jgi:uncharacterized membrane protein|nr:glycerophosphodiester phosphodiesterase [Anaerosporomusa subterranea]